ncbi:hypothetical protein TJA_20270 [Thermus sp. LT1-2-5]|uniref:hypothetical protein n=1 Tax=Thermus sp. LT1-2-5 TaxID=3026935 RepID=UPI0030E96110
MILAALDEWVPLSILVKPEMVLWGLSHPFASFLHAVIVTHERDTLEVDEPIMDHEAVYLMREVEEEWKRRGEKILPTRKKTIVLLADVGYLSIYFRFSDAFGGEGKPFGILDDLFGDPDIEGHLSRWAVGLEEIPGWPLMPPGLIRIHFLLGPILRHWSRRNILYFGRDFTYFQVSPEPDIDLMSLCSTLIRKEEVPHAHKKALMDIAMTAASGNKARLSKQVGKTHFYLLSSYMRGVWNDDLKARWGAWWARPDAPNNRKQMAEYAERLRKETLEYYGCKDLFPELWEWKRILEEEWRKSASRQV